MLLVTQHKTLLGLLSPFYQTCIVAFVDHYEENPLKKVSLVVQTPM